jgi:peptidoglycan hydrolase CwlO-like protein
MAKIIPKLTLVVLIVCFLACASSSKSGSKKAGVTDEDSESNLGTEEGFANKKKKIESLKEELEGINTQIKERQKLLDELNNIKQVIDTDTLIEEGSNY